VLFVRPLTAEELAQRREVLKQRLAEKKKDFDQANIASELSNGNLVSLLLCLLNYETMIV